MAVSSRALKAGEAFIALVLDDKEFNDSLRDWEARFRRISRRIQPLGTSLASLGTALVAPFAAGTRALTTYGDEINRAALRTGVAADEFSRMALLAELAGSDAETLSDAVTTLGERLIQASEGSGEAARAFEDLGLSVSSILTATDDPVQRFQMVANAINSIADESLRAGVAQSIFADSALALIAATGRFNENADFVRQAQLTEQNSEAAEQLTLEYRKLIASVRVVGVELATAVLPALISTAQWATETALSFRRFVSDNQTLVRWIGGLGTGMLTLGAAIKTLPIVISATSTAFRAMQVSISGVAAGLRVLIPLLVTVDMHLSGIAVRLTLVGSAASFATAAMAAFLVPMSLIGGTGPVSGVLTWFDGLNARLWEMVAALSILPGQMRQFATVMATVFRANIQRRFAPELAGVAGAPPLVGPPSFLAETQRGGLSTSGIAARFASQQTLGFSQSQTMDHQRQTAENTSQLVREMMNLNNNLQQQNTLN